MEQQHSGLRTAYGETIFRQKYAQNMLETWDDRSSIVVDYICGTRGGTETPLLSREDRDGLREGISTCKIMPGGRPIYYAGRDPRQPFSTTATCHVG